MAYERQSRSDQQFSLELSFRVGTSGLKRRRLSVTVKFDSGQPTEAILGTILARYILPKAWMELLQHMRLKYLAVQLNSPPGTNTGLL